MFNFRCIKALIFLISLTSIAFAEIPEKLLIEGNEYYQNSEFIKAIEIYESIIESGYEGTSLYYNLGNAYYREGKIGFAILNYERALKLSPGDEDVQHNIALANTKTMDKIETLPKFFIFQWWESILSFFTVKSWTYTAYFFYIILLTIIGLYFFDKETKHQKIYFYSGMTSTLLLVISVLLLSVKLNRELNIKNAIIVEPAAAVKQSPDSLSGDAFIIHEGLKVKLEDNIDDWVKIRLNDGKIGWLPKENLRII